MPTGDDPLPEPSDAMAGDLVEAYWALDLMQAKFLADQLSEQGIPAVSDVHDMHDTLGSMSSGPRVWVRAADLLRAKAWLESYDQQFKPSTGLPTATERTIVLRRPLGQRNTRPGNRHPGYGLMNLVLASTSRYRRALLKRLGLPFRCLVPLVDEEDWKIGDWGPRELAEHLALAKAQSLAEAEPLATLIGSDQVVSFEGRIYGKPVSHERACAQLAAMSGMSHTLITAVAVWHLGHAYVHYRPDDDAHASLEC